MFHRTGCRRCVALPRWNPVWKRTRGGRAGVGGGGRPGFPAPDAVLERHPCPRPISRLPEGCCSTDRSSVDRCRRHPTPWRGVRRRRVAAHPDGAVRRPRGGSGVSGPVGEIRERQQRHGGCRVRAGAPGRRGRGADSRPVRRGATRRGGAPSGAPGRTSTPRTAGPGAGRTDGSGHTRIGQPGGNPVAAPPSRPPIAVP